MEDAVSDMSSSLKSAFEEGRSRVFGEGLDRGFYVLLLVALLGGALALAWRQGNMDPVAILIGIASMAIFVAMPFLAVTIFCTAISLLSQWTGTRDDADPPMAAVLGACAITLAIIVSIVGGISQIPLVGAQLRSIFL
jgi:energy-converting hydrogenase Eha subunit B